MVGTELDDIVEEFVHHRFGQEIEGEMFPQADEAHFSDVIRGVVREQREIDQAINGALAKGWTLARSEEHTSELQSLMRISYAVFCLKNKIKADNTMSHV